MYLASQTICTFDMHVLWHAIRESLVTGHVDRVDKEVEGNENKMKRVGALAQLSD